MAFKNLKFNKGIIKSKYHLLCKNNSVNNQIILRYKEVLYFFENWLLGLFEDEPLPYEITHLLFLLNFKNNFVSLSFSGGEYLNENNYPLDYYPLEAQFFYCYTFFHLYKNYYSLKTKKSARINLLKNFYFLVCKRLIIDFLENNKSIDFKHKKIFLGEESLQKNLCINIQ